MAEKLTGVYYYFDCMNAFVTDRYFKSTAFKDEAEAIHTASNYEATLYKLEFNEDGEQVSKTVIYDPYACFN